MTISLLTAVGAPVALLLWVWVYAVSPGPAGEMAIGTQETAGNPKIVSIPPGTGLKGIKRRLAAEGVVRDDLRFELLARLLGVAQHLKAGEYRFEFRLSPYEVLQVLEDGQVVRWPVTLPEGVTMYQTADLLAAEGLVDRERFLALAADADFIAGLGLSGATLEGYLFPDTYYLERGQKEEAIIAMMVNRLRKVIRALCGSEPEGGIEALVAMCSESPASGAFSLHEVLTLASIVEKETGYPAERPLVASVFWNRLEKGMRLQADPTVIYGIPEFNGNITRQDLRAETPYNTYVIRGLPPTPIANPGQAAIQAVLRPAETSYLFFVASSDGQHQFSETLAEHNKAVRLYQKRKQAQASGRQIAPSSP